MGPHIGSMMNLISKSGVRYVGVLVGVDAKECALSLAQGEIIAHNAMRIPLLGLLSPLLRYRGEVADA